MTMRKAEGIDDGKVERQWMWQWTAALMADVAIDGGSVVGCHWHWGRRTVMAGGQLTVINNVVRGQPGGGGWR